MTATAVETSAPVLEFHDEHLHAWQGHYDVPNEDDKVWKKLIDGISVKRAAGICSSGEIGFFTLLPCVSDELILIDHSYESLAIAMMKYLLVREKGWKEARKILTTSSNASELSSLLLSLADLLPEPVKKAYYRLSGSTPGDHGNNGPFLYRRYSWDYAAGAYVYEDETTTSSLATWWSTNRVSDKELKAFESNLHKIKFMHGDLTDLEKHGPFQLLYLSNALEHSYGRAGHPPVSGISKCLSAGSLIFAAVDPSDYHRTKEPLKSTFEVVKFADRVECHASCAWEQYLLRVPEEAKLEAAA